MTFKECLEALGAGEDIPPEEECMLFPREREWLSRVRRGDSIFLNEYDMKRKLSGEGWMRCLLGKDIWFFNKNTKLAVPEKIAARLFGGIYVARGNKLVKGINYLIEGEPDNEEWPLWVVDPMAYRVFVG